MARLATLAPRLATIDTRTARPPRAAKATQPFYRSGQWRRFIAEIIRERGRKCQECGSAGCRIFGDHIQELNDGGAPFDKDNILLRCGRCHNKKTATEKKKRFNGRELSHPEGLCPSQVPLVIVCGPPASGKTTYVREHSAPGDLVIDLDVIKSRLLGGSLHAWSSQYLGAALVERNRLLAQLSQWPAKWPRAWFIVGEPTPQMRAWWQRTLCPSRVVVVETPDEVCLQRIASSPERAATRAEQSEAVMKWWAAYRPRAGEHVIARGHVQA